MSCYKEMYYLMFNAVTSALEQIDKNQTAQARIALINAQKASEEIFLSAADNEPEAGKNFGNLRIIK